MVTKVICVTKDEYDLIETFIVFYGKIFGYNNVIIIDNGSTDQRVLDVYKKYPEVEVRVDAFCFQQVTEVMTKYIIEYKDTCDYMLLLETDEYLYWEGDDELDEDKVRRYIETLPSQARFGKIYQSVVGPDEVFVSPAREITKFRSQVADKVIIKTSMFERMQMWPHHTVPSEKVHSTEGLCLLHFHNTGQKRHIERSYNLVKGYGYLSGEEPLDEQIHMCRYLISNSVYGNHRVKYYLDHLLGIEPITDTTYELEIHQLVRWYAS